MHIRINGRRIFHFAHRFITSEVRKIFQVATKSTYICICISLYLFRHLQWLQKVFEHRCIYSYAYSGYIKRLHAVHLLFIFAFTVATENICPALYSFFAFTVIRQNVYTALYLFSRLQRLQKECLHIAVFILTAKR